ncbi:MAG: PQQ-dependent sugar dehydrogenase [Chloroflexi bacterium]|nr:PQQ-dependent sugar dehydrogenase [Chloroflexota bacterium]
MKRLLLLLTLPILACGGLAESVLPTSTPPAPPTVVSVASTETQPALDTATVPPTSSATPTAIASSFPDANAYEWKLIASGLDRPVDIQSANDDTGRLFIIEKYGVIRIYENGQLLDRPFLDISDRVGSSGNEQGLLGFAFYPRPEAGMLFVNYTDKNGDTVISRFLWDTYANPMSENVLLNIDQPYPNHNGGALAFGPDGYLYAGLGDGGFAGDPHKNGQNTNSLLGKILRLDVNDFNAPNVYLIPFDNPFGNEVWAYGLRNPWRISFDRVTGDLWIGDVGQGSWEEVDYLPAGSQGGANFGWSIMEGNHGYDGNPQPGMFLPVAEYSHAEGCSITGGYVYRGTAMPEWNGIYLYGDYCSGKIWGLYQSETGWQSQVMFEAGVTITSFGQDESGEIYFASDNGGIYHLTPSR